MKLEILLTPPRPPFAIGLLCLLLVSGSGRVASEEAADQILERAREVYLEEGPGPALPLYERALEAFRAAGDRRGEAITLGLMGNCRKRFGEYDEALELLSTALEMKRQLGERAEEGATLSHLGLVYWELGEYQVAIERFESSSEIAREVGDAELEGANLNNLSLVYDELGEYERSLEQYQQALDVYRGVDFPRGESDTLGNMGGVHLLLGHYREACELYRQSLAIGEREGLKYSMSVDRGNLALCQLGLGRVEEALADFDRALALTRQIGAHQDEAYWLSGKGRALVGLGRYDEGLSLFRESVERYEEMGARGEMIEALHELGALYVRLGDLASAEVNLRRAVETAREIGSARAVTLGLQALGDLEWRRGHEEQAGALYAEALRRAREANEESLVAEGLLGIAAIELQSSRLDEAASRAGEALEIGRRIEALAVEAEAQFALGEIGRLRGAAEVALTLFDEAETSAGRLGDPDLLWRIKHGQGRTLEQAGRNEEAVAALEDSVVIIESVRGRLREERFRAGYLQDKYQVYVDLVRLLLRAGRTEAAFGIAERLRAHGYLELVSRRRSGLRSEQQRLLEVELVERIRQLQQAIDAERGRVGAEYRQRAVDFFSHELVAAETEYQTFLDDLRRVDPSSAAQREVVVPTVGQVQAGLPADALLLEYVLAEDSVFVFGITRGQLRSHEVRVGGKDLYARVALLRDLIRQPANEDWRRPAASLAAVLLHPLIEAGWLDGAERLYVVPHGALHFLPFGVLPMSSRGERLVVEDLAVTLLPAAAVLAGGLKAETAEKSLLAMAPASTGLAHAADEVQGVSELFGRDPTVLIGDSALESVFKDLAPGYRVVHLASHGYFNKLNPMLSGLELEADATDDGRLQVHEILDLSLAADLVVLSACETGLSSGHLAEIPVGDDFVGLTRAFLHAGSNAVLSTLWQVNDRFTVTVMQGFYRRVATTGEVGDLSLALAEAQRDGLRHPRYGHPYYWAPFVLVGASGTETALLAENRTAVLVEEE